ncbi:nitrilase family protein, partial [Schleiferiaceae bacterium]|nr:nitrilase family protein [Schleiferiaceae bacterium]
VPANWPEARQSAWDTLLRARAMENQCYVLGVNRIGEDGFRVEHSGGTASIGPWGDVLAQGESGEAGWVTSTWESVHLAAVRKRYPFLGDADAFTLG